MEIKIRKAEETHFPQIVGLFKEFALLRNDRNK
jgi:hypothetical protein